MEKGTLSIEKRKHPRIALEAKVQFRRLAQDEKNEAMAAMTTAKSRDLSQGGIALVETAKLQAGDLIKLEIEVPGRDKSIKAYSEVMWIKPPGAGEDANIEIAGIKFMGLSPEDEKFLGHLVSTSDDKLPEPDADPRAEAKRLSEKEFIKKMGKRFTGDR